MQMSLILDNAIYLTLPSSKTYSRQARRTLRSRMKNASQAASTECSSAPLLGQEPPPADSECSSAPLLGQEPPPADSKCSSAPLSGQEPQVPLPADSECSSAPLSG